jgi:hypothetical protein
VPQQVAQQILCQIFPPQLHGDINCFYQKRTEECRVLKNLFDLKKVTVDVEVYCDLHYKYMLRVADETNIAAVWAALYNIFQEYPAEAPEDIKTYWDSNKDTLFRLQMLILSSIVGFERAGEINDFFKLLREETIRARELFASTEA